MITQGRGGIRITFTRGGRGMVVQEVISSNTIIDLIRIALTKRYIIWKVV